MAASYICRNSKLLSSSRAFFSTQTTPFSSFRAAKSAILSEPNPDKLVEIFEQSAHFPTFRRHRPIFQSSIHKLARANRPDLVNRLLQAQQNEGPPVKSEGFMIRLIMLYSSAGMVDQAMNALENFLNKRHFEFSEKSLCAILSVHLNNGIYEKVHQLFETMPQRINVVPGVVSNNLVLKAFVMQNKVESARDWIQTMKKDGNVMPSIDSYNILMGAYLNKRDAGGFDGVVKEVLSQGLKNNLTTYNYRILTFCKNKECVRAKKLLDEMVSKGVKPNSTSYNAIIYGFCRLGDFESAKKVLESMLADGYASPCSVTYYSLIRKMVKEGEFDSALEVFKEIIKRKWVPPFEATEGLLRGLLEKSQVEEAKEVVEEMKKRLKGAAAKSWGNIEAALPLQASS